MRTMLDWSQEEKDIYDLVQRIEKLGGSPALTNCVIHLSSAREELEKHLVNEPPPIPEECIACTYSGSDEAMYCAYGCPSCTCKK